MMRLIVHVLAIAIVLVAAFTTLADPFGFAGWPLSDSVSRPGRHDRDRFIKPWDILLQKPETILFGSSRVKEGFNPDRAPAIFGRTYNGGIDGAPPAEIHDLLKFAAEHDPNLKTAIIELFFSHFIGETVKSVSFTPHGLRYIADPTIAYLSPAAIALSYQTLHDLARGRFIPLTVRRNGYIFQPLPAANGVNFVRGYADSAKGLPELLSYGLSRDAFAEFSDMRKTCDTSGIRCIFFVSPLGGFVLSCIERSHFLSIYTNWLQLLAQNNSVADFSDLAFENLDGPMPGWANTVHFSEKTGDEILIALASNKYRRIERATVAATSQALTRRVLQWTENNIALAPDASCPK